MALATPSKRRQPLEKRRLGPWTLGMDEKSDPSMIPQNKCAAAQNVMLDETTGDAVKRWGSLTLSTLPSGNPPRDTYHFIKSTGAEYALASDGTTLYFTQDGITWTQIVTGLTSSAFMEFETAEDKVWMTNGVDKVMSWDGATLFTYDRTKTATQNASSVTNATIVSNDFTEADNFWTGQKIVWTLGNNIGFISTVTGYVQSTKTLTFSPTLPNAAAVTDRWTLGLIIPAGKAMRFWDGHLFIGCTAANPSEERFNTLTDPNAGTAITIDHPLAWPSSYSVEIYVNDGDRVWGNSPVLRDRFLISKGNKIFRLERDSQTLYRPVLVTSSIGSRFPDTWCERDGTLLFVGTAKDGYPDVFKTDMVDVVPADPLSGLEPTFRSLQQANSIQRFSGFFTKADFGSWTKSTGIDTTKGDLEIAGYGGPNGVDFNNFFSNNNTGPDDAAGVLSLLGVPAWSLRYEAANLPENEVIPWATTPGGDSEVQFALIETGNLFLVAVNSGGPTLGEYERFQRGVLSADQNSYLYVKAQGVLHFGLWNGAKGAYVLVFGNTIFLHGTTVQSLVVAAGFHEYHLLLTSAGTAQLWIDGALKMTVTAAVTSYNKVQFGLGAVTLVDAFVGSDNALAFSANGQSATIQRVYYNSNLINISIPATIPASGQIVLPFNYTRAPDALRKVSTSFLCNYFGAKCGVTAASVTVQIFSNIATSYSPDMTRFSAGQVVDIMSIATRQPIQNGRNRVIQSVNAGAFTITLDAGGGVVTTDTTMGVYIQNGGLTMQSWTADSADFTQNPDPQGYVAVANGAIPISLTKQFQRLQLALTRADLGNSPEISAIYTGMLSISPPIFIGKSISAWQTFLDLLNNGGAAPSGIFQGVKIRSATVTTIPTEGQWSAWSSIVSGNNIGSILADGSPPSSVWVQLKVEQGPGFSAGSPTLPIIGALQIQWLEGSAALIPFRGIVHKRRYMISGALPGATTNNILVVLDRNSAWIKYVGLNLNALEHFQTSLLGFAADSAKIKKLDIQGRLDDDGVGIDAFIVTGEDDFEAAALRKDFRFAYLHIKGNAGDTLTVSSKRNTDPAFTVHATITLDGNNDDKKIPFPAAFLARRLQRKYENAVAGQNMNIKGETIHWHDRSQGT